MKKILYGLAFLASISISSCEKETINPDDTLGNISGMGNNTGNHLVKGPFSLPEGILYVNSIIESEKQTLSSTQFGSGSGIRLEMTLYNPTDILKTVFLQKGLIFECNSPQNHDGILLQTTWFNVNARSVRKVILNVYDLDSQQQPDTIRNTYDIIGESDSQVINKLLNSIGWRKINYEMIFGTLSGTKSSASVPTYVEIGQRLQGIIDNLIYNMIDISAEDTEFIKGIPELVKQDIPLMNEMGQFPTYFEEFKFSDI